MVTGPASRQERKAEGAATRRATGEARQLASDLPRLVLESRRIAATVIHGLHGRRRSGSGENFWQFRRYSPGEEIRRIDWRRSARDDNLYIREQEWEAAHTVWLWADRSPSMAFQSKLASETKLDRTLTLSMALGDILVDAGERVGMPGLMRPTGSRAIIDKMADALLHDGAERSSLPSGFAPHALAEMVLLSDFWAPIAETRRTLSQLSETGAQGHLIQVVDPAEESFPYSGRVEFVEPEGGGEITAGRAETWRADFEKRVAEHRAALRAETDRLGWSFTIHRTDRPANDLLLALHTRIGQGNAAVAMSRRRSA